MEFLSDVEVRVLGALIEKDITTPDYYPLSLNALVNACNQKNNREPVMALGEDAVRAALESLQRQRLAGPASGADGRVTKYEHRLQEVFNFDRRETAILCVLLLRGAQTPGELRGRTERMYRFEELEDVHATIEKLSQREPALVAVLPRQPGRRSRGTCICCRGKRRWERLCPSIRLLLPVAVASACWRMKLRTFDGKLRRCGNSWQRFGSSSNKSFHRGDRGERPAEGRGKASLRSKHRLVRGTQGEVPRIRSIMR